MHTAALLLLTSLALADLGEVPPLAVDDTLDWTSIVDGEASDAYLIVNHQPSRRRLRGDWESPDSVVLVYSAYWQETIFDLARTLMRFTDVLVLVRPQDGLTRVEDAFAKAGVRRDRLSLLLLDVDTVWVRDFGPLQAAEGRDPIWLNASYPSRPLDDTVPLRLAAQHAVLVEEVPENLDGGALVSNGAGLCATTTESFEKAGLDDTDVAGMDAFMGQLGCRLLVLLPALSRDPNQHVDMFLQFTAPDRAVLAEFDPNLEPRDSMSVEIAEERLRRAARAIGIELSIDPVPTPTAPDGTYFTYLNGLQVGGAYLAPQYDAVSAEEERLAFAALAQAFGSKRQVIPINTDAMIELHGALHCVTLGLFHTSRPSLASYRLTPKPSGLRPRTARGRL